MTRRRGAPVWLALLLLLALPVVAHAHGALRSAIPKSGARLAEPPRELRLTFSEPVELALARLTLAAADGRAVPLSPLRRGASAAVVVADVVGSALAAGVYTVGWQVVGHDGHPVRGSYRFTVLAGTPPAAAAPAAEVAPAPADTSPAPAATRVPADAFGVGSLLYAVARWLAFLGLLGLVGTAAFAIAVLPAAARRAVPPAVADWSAHRARTVGLAAAGLLAVASLLRLAAQSAAVNGAGHAFERAELLPLVAGTTWGRGWTLQLGAALAALALLALARRRPGRAWLPVAACAVVAVVGAAHSGHAAAVDDHRALALSADALHVLAAGGWVGTLLLLAAAGLPAARRAAPGERVGVAAAFVGAFSPWALACAAVAAATGATSAWLHLGAPAALWSTAYGRTLLVKLALLVPAAGAGAYNWRRARPALAAGTDVTAPLAQSVGVELLAAIAVVAVTAVLVAVSPPP